MTEPKDKSTETSNEPVTSPTWKPEPPALDVEPEDVTNDESDKPPVPMGQTSSDEDPAESDPENTATHHKGRVPLSPTTK